MSNRLIQNILSAYKNQLDQLPQPLKNRKAIHAMTHCRTREMGMSYYACKDNHEGIEHFHSCRHRSCYICAQKKRHEWIETQKTRLLNTPHFHVVFTLPHEYLDLWRYNEALFSSLLFKASQKTLLELMEDKSRWGVVPGILMALHSWGRKLTLHPHTHCLVTAGGLDAQGHWKATGKYLLPSGVIRRVYRGKMQSLIYEAYKNKQLKWPPGFTEETFFRKYRSLYKKEWSVHIEERYEHAKGVLLYLARYCKGGPVSPEQIVSCSDKQIEMSYHDHRENRNKRQSLRPMEFIGRLLQHVPVPGQHTIRYYGVYAPSAKRKYEQCFKKHGSIETERKDNPASNSLVMLYCKTCCQPTTLRYRFWPSRHRKKGISIYKEAGHLSEPGYVQQDDETDITKKSIEDTS